MDGTAPVLGWLTTAPTLETCPKARLPMLKHRFCPHSLSIHIGGTQRARGACHSALRLSRTSAPLRGVGLVHLDNRDASPVRLLFDVSPKLPERPGVRPPVEPSPFTVTPDSLRVPDCNDSIQPLRLVHDCLGDFLQLVACGESLFAPDPLYHFQQLLFSESPSQVEVMSPRSSQLSPVEVDLARPLSTEHATCRIPISMARTEE